MGTIAAARGCGGAGACAAGAGAPDTACTAWACAGADFCAAAAFGAGAACGNDPVAASAGGDGEGVAGGVTHCFVVASRVIPREAQKSCDGCMALMKLLPPDAPGGAQAVSVSAAKIKTCRTSAPSEGTPPKTARRPMKWRTTRDSDAKPYPYTARACSRFSAGGGYSAGRSGQPGLIWVNAGCTGLARFNLWARCIHCQNNNGCRFQSRRLTSILRSASWTSLESMHWYFPSAGTGWIGPMRQPKSRSILHRRIGARGARCANRPSFRSLCARSNL